MTEVEVKHRGGEKVDAAPRRAAPVLRSVHDPLQAQQRRAIVRVVLVLTGLVAGVGLIGASLYLLVLQSSEPGIPSAGSIPTLAAGSSHSYLSFVVEPETAQISLNGRLLDESQGSSHEVDPGSYLITVRAEGYSRLDSLVQLRPNAAFVFVASLDEMRRVEPDEEAEAVRESPVAPTEVTGSLTVRSNVEGARVMIDGRLAGRAPLTTSLHPGSYLVRLEADGHRPVSRSVEVMEGSTLDVLETLVAQTGLVRVLVIPWGTIHVNGQMHAENSDIRHTIELPAGRNVISAQHPVLGRLERTVDVRPDESLDVVFEYRQ